MESSTMELTIRKLWQSHEGLFETPDGSANCYNGIQTREEPAVDVKRKGYRPCTILGLHIINPYSIKK